MIFLFEFDLNSLREFISNADNRENVLTIHLSNEFEGCKSSIIVREEQFKGWKSSIIDREEHIKIIYH